MYNWIEIFHRAGLSDAQILNPEYLLSNFEGQPYCKACDSYVIESVEKHMRVHASQIRTYKRQKVEDKKKEFYDNPCVVCGSLINKTGKKGRQPSKHEGCK